MSLVAKSGWVTVPVVATAGVVSAAELGLQVPWKEMWAQWMMFVFAGLCAGFFYGRGNERFVTISLALLQFTMFGIAYGVAMYAACALARPLIDERLMAADATFGLHLPTIVEWIGTYPMLRLIFDICYNTLLPQTMLVIVGGGFVGRSREVHDFLLGLFLCSLVALVVFAIWPAVGPFSAYGYELSPPQQQYVEQFHAIRDGRLREIPWPDATGLITFPSMHTSWALLLIYAVRWSRWLWVPSVLLNLAIIVSTMTTGWHYVSDVLAGVAVAGCVIAANQVWELKGRGIRIADGTAEFRRPAMNQPV
jgi:membrane-associated phospholipid phosphatase